MSKEVFQELLESAFLSQVRLDIDYLLQTKTEDTFNKLLRGGLIDIIQTVYDEDHPHDSEGYIIIKVGSDHYKVDMHELEYGEIVYPIKSLTRAVQKVKEVTYYDWEGNV